LAKGKMGPFGVVVDQPIHKVAVPLFKIIGHKVKIHVHKFLLDSAVKALYAGIHLGASGIVPEVDDALFLASFMKVFIELAAIVGLNSFYLKGSDCLKLS
jgi:hypothetical protein